ncbi:hypothetical protein [Martelella endophytica]|nr:hypothetical protein [Martelella endophytica]
MKRHLVAAAACLFLAASPVLAAPFIHDQSAVPHPGKTEKAPVGSTFTIDTYGKFGVQYANVFKVQPDRSSKLVYQYVTASQPTND